MDPTIQFVILLAAFIAFVVEFVRGWPAPTYLALGLALWVTVPLWAAAQRAF